jgi:putative DNA primase/helicase
MSKLDAAKVRQDAIGKWPSILAACGVDKAYLGRKNGPCPLCQDGRDRFKFDDKEGRGTWLCSHCGAGDGFALLQKLKGWNFGEALREVAALTGTARPVKIRQGRPEAAVREEMNAIWRRARPIAEVEAAVLWWLHRLGEIPASPNLRALPQLPCFGHGDHPAMVAMIHGPDGKPVSLHRTYLTPDGRKADIPEPRRVMDIELPKGSAIRLAPATDVLGVAEGIETAESCRLLFGVPTWATISAGNMKGFVPPPEIRRLVIFGELDGSFTGQAAAFELARACWAKRKQWDPELVVEVRIHGVTFDPNAWDRDWNDVWQSNRQIDAEPAQTVRAA